MDHPSWMWRRQRALIMIAAGAVVIAAAGVAAGSRLRSPEQVAAETREPTATVLTAPVERRVLKDVVVLRGSIVPARTVEVTPSAAVGSDRMVITRLNIKPGDPVPAATVLLAVSGRPLFALQGSIPAYRDLRPGARGDDVGQLQAALRLLSMSIRDAKGYFGADTKRAVNALYARIGYPTAPAGTDDDEALRAAARRVRDAQRALEEVEATGDASAVTRAREDLTDAGEEHARVVERTGPMIPSSEVVFLPVLPARVMKLTASVGGAVTAPLITIASGALVVQSEVSPAERPLIRPDQEVEIFAESAGVTVNGRVAEVGGLTDQGGVRLHSVTIAGTFGEDLSGAEARVTIVVANTATEVLVVPLSAIFVGADERTSVTRLDPNGSQVRVFVDVGLSGDGYVEVRPTGASLTSGDLIVVGLASTKAAPR